jgi:proline iminopeptidase
VSKDEFDLMVRLRRQAATHDVAELDAIAATPAYANGDPDTVAAYYRVHFRRALARPADLERVIASLRASFTSEGILLARAIEDRLTDETWLADAYDPLAQLAARSIPTLIIAGDHDIVPAAIVDHMAARIHGARLVTLQGCGHFASLECPDATQAADRDIPRRGRRAAAEGSMTRPADAAAPR